MALFHNYYVYILLCSDQSYYTGITNDTERRLYEHNLKIMHYPIHFQEDH
jgi:predicted GIY-YIG superfamily endonuclease